jgi:hypothetical protein
MRPRRLDDTDEFDEEDEVLYLGGGDEAKDSAARPRK